MRIGILGAGSIGAYLGGRLVAAGVPVTFVGRASLAEAVAAHGLRLTDLGGFDVTLPPERVTIATEARALADCDVILVTVKGLDTRTAGEKLAAIARPDALVVSFQNGVRNREVLAAALGEHPIVVAGMVGFNVLRRAPSHLHQGTSGRLVLAPLPDRREQPLVAALIKAGLPTAVQADMQRALWGKLLVNLNNSINALSGVPLLEQLRQRGYRRAMAACTREGLEVLRAANIRPWLDAPLPPAWLPSLLELPDWLFARVAKPLLAVDPNARSSMWEDLQRGRHTEIDLLNGEIVALGAQLNVKTPYNSRVMELIKIAEKGAPPSLSAEQLQQKLFSDPAQAGAPPN
jgi:2-dehydropantoate 2-reductase